MSAGVFDLSVGANLVLASVIAARAMRALGDWGVSIPSQPFFSALLSALSRAPSFGVINGLIITKLRGELADCDAWYARRRIGRRRNC